MRLINWWRRKRQFSMIKRLIMSGVGVKEVQFKRQSPLNAAMRRELAGTVTLSLQNEMALARSPYGVDQLAIAFSLKSQNQRLIGMGTLGILPRTCLHDGRAFDGIVAFLDDHLSHLQPREITLTVACLNMGDIVWEYLKKEEK